MSRLRIGLVASLAVNLFLASALVAGYASLRTAKQMVNAGALRVASSDLPPREARAFRQALRGERRSMRQMIDVSRSAKMRAAGLLRRSGVDQAAVLSELDRARKADIAIRAAVERRAVAFAAGLPQVDRAKLAEAMERRGRRFAPNGG